jgi:hypothetical protein
MQTPAAHAPGQPELEQAIPSGALATVQAPVVLSHTPT